MTTMPTPCSHRANVSGCCALVWCHSIEAARDGMTSFLWALPRGYKSISSPLLAHMAVRWRMDGLSTLVGALDGV